MHTAPQLPVHRMLVPGLLFVGMVVAVVGSLGAPLIPTLAATDHVSLGTAQWSLIVTFLVAAVATPLMGRLGDGPHRRTVILGALVIVAIGGTLATLPLGFPTLLVGRALQGVGLGLTPLTITVARDALSGERARPALAMLSITTVAGVGLGYPVTALIVQHGGLHAAFWFGVTVSLAALLTAVVIVPSSQHLPCVRLDLAGAAILGAALAGLLLDISEGERWGWSSLRLLGVAAASVVAFVIWVFVELRRAHPLVELRLLRRPAVLTADAAGVMAGVGMYLLMSLVTRLVQTPSSSGYGLGGSIAVAGLMLTPFSIASIASSRLVRVLLERLTPRLILPFSAALLLVAMIVFTVAHGALWEIAVVMGIAGLGVGAIFAVTPSFIVAAVPLHETGSALSFNQVLRYVGYGIGSTLSAVILEAHTAPGHALPEGHGYTIAGLVGCAMWLATIAVTFTLPHLGRSVPAQTEPDPGELELLEDESVADAIPPERGSASQLETTPTGAPR